MRPILLLVPLLLLAAAPALAQTAGTPLRPNTPPGGGPDRRPPPAALPGLVGRQAPAPIPGDPTLSLSPNAALFDAISRGDLPAARDAVSRGADLNARNVLGLTPIDAAVDQGRNEIAFFLLSARGSTARGPAGPPPGTAPDGTDPAGATPRRGTPPPPERAERRAAPTPPIGPAPLTSPRLFGGDGGAPAPEIGFLGFDAGRPAGAEPRAGEASRRSRGGRG